MVNMEEVNNVNMEEVNRGNMEEVESDLRKERNNIGIRAAGDLLSGNNHQNLIIRAL